MRMAPASTMASTIAWTLPVALIWATQHGAQTSGAAAAMPDASTPAPAEAARPVPRTVPVVLTTTAGTITIALEVERAPLTAANFLKYVDQKRLDGTTFYRAFTYAEMPDIGLVQGGTKNDPKRILKPVPHEPTTKTGLTHDDGAVSLARAAPGSGTCDFSIMLGGMKGLDANPQGTGDTAGYAVFGHVTAGMDVARAMATMPRDPNLGVGVMKGQMLAKPVRIITARRVVSGK